MAVNMAVNKRQAPSGFFVAPISNPLLNGPRLSTYNLNCLDVEDSH